MNPFRYGCVVQGDHFCPRRLQEEELKRLVEGGQNVMIQGDRRMGKTSLVKDLAGKLGEIAFIYVDMLGIRSIHDLARKLTAAMAEIDRRRSFLSKLLKFLAALRPSLTLDPSGGATLSVDVGKTSTIESLETLMDALGRLGQTRRLCVVLDEFQDILKLDDATSILAMLRGKIQFHEGVSYIFLGSIRNKMSELFTSSRQPFYKSAVILDIGHIDDEDFIPFIQRKFEDTGRHIGTETILTILKLADRISGDVQELCDALWATTAEGDAITEENLEPALQLIFARESKSYTPIMNQLPKIQMRVLKAVALFGGHKPTGQEFLNQAGLHNAASVRKSLVRLVELDVLQIGEQGDYRFANPFFREWLRRQ